VKKPKGILIILAVIVCSLFVAAPALATTRLNSYEKRIVSLVNQKRVSKGLPKLRVNARLVKAARSHSAQMGERKYFQHDTFRRDANGSLCRVRTWSKRIVRFGYTYQGYRYWKVGENIYHGANLYSSAEACFRHWMKSPAHRAVILTKAFRNIGVGAVKTDTGYKACGGAVWFYTMDVGRRIAR